MTAPPQPPPADPTKTEPSKTEPSKTEPSKTEPKKTSWQRLSIGQLLWVLGAVALGVTAVFGGLRSSDYATDLSLNQTYDNGALLLTPRSVNILSDGFGLPSLPHCEFVTLRITVDNPTDRRVPLPTPWPLDLKNDCTRAEIVGVAADEKLDEVVAVRLEGISSTFIQVSRVRDKAPLQSAEPGFTEDFDLVWAVSKDELKRDPKMRIVFAGLTEEVSKFRLDHDWIASDDRYGVLPVPNPGR